MSLSAKMLYSAFEALVERQCKYHFYTYLIKLMLHISFPLQKKPKNVVLEIKNEFQYCHCNYDGALHSEELAKKNYVLDIKMSIQL